MAMTDSLKKAQVKYNRESTRKFSLKFNNDKDTDVIEALEASGNIQGYIRSLIRADMERSGARGGITPLPVVRISFDPVKEQWSGFCSDGSLTLTSDSYDILLDRIRKMIKGAYTVITENRRFS